MRVLIVSDSYPPLIGGATRATQMLAHELAWRGHEVSVATYWQAGAPSREDDRGVSVHRIGGLSSRIPGFSADPYRRNPPPFPDPETTWRLRTLVQALAPDIVHTYGWISYSCALALARIHVPLLLSVRDYGYVCARRTLVRDEEVCAGPGRGKCLACAARFYGKPKGIVAAVGVRQGAHLLRTRVDALHSCSRYVQVLTHRWLYNGTPHFAPGCDEVLPSFRSLDIAPPDRGVLEQLPRQPFVLFVGALRRIKGLNALIAAYARLPEPRSPLVLIGIPAPDTPTSWPPDVTVIQNASHSTVMAAWDRALFGVAPSLWPEPLGNVVHEAMSRGRPVIGTAPGGHADMIDDGINGVLVPAGDVGALEAAMLRLTRDGAFRASLGIAAEAKARLFTAEAVMPRFEALYESAIASKR